MSAAADSRYLINPRAYATEPPRRHRPTAAMRKKGGGYRYVKAICVGNAKKPIKPLHGS